LATQPDRACHQFYNELPKAGIDDQPDAISDIAAYPLIDTDRA
jgi:hypothetical protein